MYLPSHFAEPDHAALHALMHAHPLATWVVADADGVQVNHVPFLLDIDAAGRATLRGHVARANPVWRALDGAAPSLLVFHGAQGYVSPGWYPSKRSDPRVVPTWNYAVVHAHGAARAVDDARWLRALLQRLTERHEATLPRPWSLADAPGDYIDRMLAAVVGVEVAVERLEGKFKLSQNRTAADRDGVVAGLRARGDAASEALAAAMAGAPPRG